VDAVLDHYVSLGMDRDPYWCRPWPAAIALAHTLLQRPELVAGVAVAGGLEFAGRSLLPSLQSRQRSTQRRVATSTTAATAAAAAAARAVTCCHLAPPPMRRQARG
jgi:predicted nicotinamide N-methyase